MKKVYACIDGLTTTTTAVIEWAAWSARRLDVPLELLHVLERDPDMAAVTVFSGAIGLGAQETLLNQLSDLDAQRGRLAQEAGGQVLARAQERALSAGVPQVDVRMRHGEVVDTVLAMEPEARLFVLGEPSVPARAEGCTSTTMWSAWYGQRNVRCSWPRLRSFQNPGTLPSPMTAAPRPPG